MKPAVAFAPNAAFIRYPEKAAYGRILPKNKIYEHSGANTRLRNMFVEQVDQIVWEYKLAPETINLPPRPDVPEIQVFSIKLKTQKLKHDVLRCIDGAVQFPIIFELHFEDRTQVVAAYKRRCTSDGGRWVTSGYFVSDWLPSMLERSSMPVALDLRGLYEQLLYQLIPIPARAEESLAELVERIELINAKEREIEATASRLSKQKQFNRKVAVNAHLRQLKGELEVLTGSRQA